jgi:hypothetical protein
MLITLTQKTVVSHLSNYLNRHYGDDLAYMGLLNVHIVTILDVKENGWDSFVAFRCVIDSPTPTCGRMYTHLQIILAQDDVLACLRDCISVDKARCADDKLITLEKGNCMFDEETLYIYPGHRITYCLDALQKIGVDDNNVYFEVSLKHEREELQRHTIALGADPAWVKKLG